MEAKPFASLSAGLLARKGTARPAMRRPHMSAMPVPTLPVSVQEDDLGWNDMGEGHDKAPPTPPPLTMAEKQPSAEGRSAGPRPAIVKQQEKLEQSLSQSAPSQAGGAEARLSVAKPAKAPVKAAMSAVAGAVRVRASKAAFTLRLDPDRHLRLRLACAVGNRSAQQIVTQALDAFLESQPQLEALARQVPQGTDGTGSD